METEVLKQVPSDKADIGKITIVEQSHEILQFDDISLVELAARTCYKSEEKIGCNIKDGIERPDKCSGIKDDCKSVSCEYHSSNKLIAALIKKGHEAMLEHGKVTFKFITNRGCYDDQTKVLTKNRGWVYFSELLGDEIFYTLDENNHLKESTAKNYIKYHVENEDLIRFKSSFIDLFVTKDHRMWVHDYNKRSDESRVWKFLPAEEMTNCRYMFNKSSVGSTVLHDHTFTIPGYTNPTKSYSNLVLNSELFFRLLGIWVTDGSLYESKTGSGNKLMIHQTKPEGKVIIEDLLFDLGLDYRYYDNTFFINCPQLYKWLKDNFIQDDDFKKTYYVRIPRWMFGMSRVVLRSFIDGVIIGDGTPITNTLDSYQIYTASKGFAEDLVELSLLIGRSSSVHTTPQRERLFPGNDKPTLCKEQYVVSFNYKNMALFDTSRSAIKEEIKYTGYVYCVELEEHNRLFVMRNGKSCWCGNCSHELVRHRLASFGQESTRYVKYDNIQYIKPVWLPELELREYTYGEFNDGIESAETVFVETMLETQKGYSKLMKQFGWSAEQAREALPNALKTEIVVTMNFREIRHMLSLRSIGTTGRPHPQIKALMTPLLEECYNRCPVLFEDLMEQYKEKNK